MTKQEHVEQSSDYRCVFWHSRTSIGTSICTSTPNSSLISHILIFYTFTYHYYAEYGPISRFQLVCDGWTDGWTDGRMDLPFYRDARMHLKKH